MLSHHFDIIDFFLSLLTLAGGEILRQIRILNIMCFFAIVECIHVMSHIVKSVKEVNRYIYMYVTLAPRQLSPTCFFEVYLTLRISCSAVDSAIRKW